MTMDYVLNHGQALVITGPQGCGKSTLAIKIAKNYGRFIQIEAHQLETTQGINDVMASDPSVVIVDGYPKGEEAELKLMSMIAGKTFVLERKSGKPKLVKAPKFIFCTGDADLFKELGPRRFSIVRIGEKS